MNVLACSDDTCGPGDEPLSGLQANVADKTITYSEFISSPNNDCTPPGDGPTSLVLIGTQTDPAPDTGSQIAFCLPRPHKLGQGAVQLSDTELIEVVDLFGELDDGCRLRLDRNGPITGTIDFQGYCQSGLDSSGYAIVFDATLAITNLCSGQTSIAELSGAAPVETL